MAFQDTLELSGARMAPGAAHRRIVWTGNPPWWLQRTDYADVGVHLETIASAAQAFDALGRYTLAKVPLYCFPTKNADGSPKRIKVDNLFGIARSDTKEPFAGVAVSETYALIQPVDAFDAADTIVKGRGARYEVMGELAGGRDLWATLALDRSLSIAGESIKPYLLFYTAHDGKSSAQFRNVTQRPECRNTLMLGLRENTRAVSVRHTGDTSAKLKQAARIMRDALGYMDEFETFANQLARTPFNRSDYGKLVDHLFPLPEERGRAQTNAVRARELLLECVMADNLANLRNTAWGALNAVSDYNEHERSIRNGTDDVNVKLERIFRRSFEDTALVDKAQDFILELVRG